MAEGIIALDIENITSLARRDERIRGYPAHDIIRAITTALERLALRLSVDIVWRIASFSFPRLSRNNAPETRDDAIGTLRMSLQMQEHGYIVPPVHQGANAADIVLTQLTLGVMRYSGIKACVLATQDSGEVFVKFVEETQRLKKQLHLVGYGYIPEILQLGRFTSSLLAEEISRILDQQGHPRAYSSDIRQNRTPAESLRALIRNPDEQIDAQHRAWIRQAAICVEKFTHGSWQGPLGHLLRGAHAHWQGPAPPDREFSDMMKVLTRTTMFAQRQILVYQPDGELIRRLQE